MGLIERMAKAVGISDEEIAELSDAEADELEKGVATFAERMAQRDLDEELPQAMDTLRSVIWRAFAPMPDDGETRSPAEIIEASLDEFKEWALAMLEAVPVAKRSELWESERHVEALVEAIRDGGAASPTGVDLEKAVASISESATVEDEMSWTEDERAEFDALKKSVAELPETIAKAIREGDAPEGDGGDDEQPKPADLAKKLDELVESVVEIDKAIEALGSGTSAQADEGDEGKERVQKSDDERYAEALLG